ncbi:ABC transporter ATP-binding protein [Saccharospirillum sp.]|uniref:ABC transporter ATP-binding protein n=1 Tax=Saccharospirillum sp. TaxID=2033801 RepID=UPI0034A0678F
MVHESIIGKHPEQERDVMLYARGLVKSFAMKSHQGWRTVEQEIRAVNDVGFSLGRGETLGLVGESGCGKSTLAKMLVRLIEPTAGSIELDGEDILSLNTEAMRQMRRRIQMIFQDPYSSLNPRMTVAEIIGESWVVFPDIVPPEKREERISELLHQVGLNTSDADRYPHQFSGGQRQRIGIARALAVEPEVIICDEPVSALDVSVQAQVINLLMDIQRDTGVAYVFIAHDLSVVRHISDRVMVMYLGEIIEGGPVEQVFEHPQHPYTAALLSSVPVQDPEQKGRRVLALPGEVPSPMNPPPGCKFHTRCPYATDICRTQAPETQGDMMQRGVRCHHTDRLDFSEYLEHIRARATG